VCPRPTWPRRVTTSLNRYKEVVHEEVAHRTPGDILASLGELEAEIQRGMKELEGMLK
jgi:type I restriction enzyme M protein